LKGANRARALTRRIVLGGTILAALAVAMVQLSAPSIGREPAPSSRLVIGVRADVSSFNIYTATNAFSQEIADLIYPRLLAEQDDFAGGPPTFAPSLARSWELSPDQLTLTMHLTQAVWSSSDPITSADVRLSQRAAGSKEVGWVGMDVKEKIESVSAPDPATVVFRFRQKYPYQLMDAVEGNVLPASVFGGIPFAEWPGRSFTETPVAGGPYRLKRYERGSVIELARNEKYWKAPLPRLDTVVFRVIPDEQTLVSELLSGGIDMMENVPVRLLPQVQASPRIRLIRSPDLSYTFICWNASRPLFSDAKVRRALTTAIDREAILEGLLPGAGRPSSGPIPSVLWAHDPALKPLPFDPDLAVKLLKEAGWEDRDGDGLLDRGGTPFRFELESNQGSGLRGNVVQMVAAQLKRIGVEAVPRVVESGAFIDRHEKHQFDAFVGTWRESTKVDLKSVFHSSAQSGGYNYGLYADKELDAAIDGARDAADAAVAKGLWRKAEAIVARDQPYTFLFEQDRFHAVPRDLTGPRPSPRTAYADLETWSWVTREKPAP